MKRITIVIGIAISVLLVLAQLSQAQIPQIMRYQGKLNDNQGIPLEGPYKLTFRIYDQETGSESLWTEPQTSVPISQGYFNVLLGQVSALDLAFDKDYWLSIQVNDDAEMVPRQRITSVSYAFRAKTADTVGGVSASQVSPQGSGSGLDADFVDGYDSNYLLDISKHTGTVGLSNIPQGTGSGLEADLLDSQHGTFYLSRTSHTGTQIPSTIAPQGSGSGLNADTVDSIHASTSASANKLLALNANAKLPASITGDADTVDGFHASASPSANKLIVLDGNGKIPRGALKIYDSGWFAVETNRSYTKTHFLGTTNVLCQIWASASSTGIDAQLVGEITHSSWPDLTYGAIVADLSLNSVVIVTGKRRITSTDTGWYWGGSVDVLTSGYYRVVMISLD